MGVDVSALAIRRARCLLREAGLSSKGFVCQVSNFFKFPTSREVEAFDVVFDYSFLCALPLSFRPKYVKKVTEILKDSKGILITIFPGNSYTGEPNNMRGGPPYEVDSEMLKYLMESYNFETLRLEKLENSIPRRKDKEWIGIFKLK